MHVYLTVPYEDRLLAKMNGAHWDPGVKKWYVVDRQSFVQCKRWVPRITPEIIAWLESPEYGEVKKVQPRVIRSPEQERRFKAKKDRAIRLKKVSSRRGRKRLRTKMKLVNEAPNHDPPQFPIMQKGHCRYGRLKSGKYKGPSTDTSSVTIKLPF